MKRQLFSLPLLLLLAGCDMLDYHPYDVRVKGERNINASNIARIEEVRREEIIGLLRTIYHPDGTEQDCRDPRWLRKARWWYRLRLLRRFLIPLFSRLGV